MVVGEELGGESCCVRASVVLLEYGILVSQKRKGVWAQNFLHVSLGSYAPLDVHQGAPSSGIDRPPHHDASTTMNGCLIHTVGRVTFVYSPVDPPPTIMSLEQEVGLVAEPHVSPVIPDGPAMVLVAPLHSVLAMAAGEDSSSVRSASSQTSFMQAVPHGLVR